MSEPTKTSWRIAGEEFGSCNCAWGCPCQFNALPTHGRCEAFLGCLVSDGYFGNTRLDGIRFARLYWWPGAIHEGNGVRRTIVDEQATKEQRETWRVGGHGPYRLPKVVVPRLQGHVDVYLGVDVIDAESKLTCLAG